MGCGSSHPEVEGFNPRDFQARTETKGVWDDDFKLKSKPPGAGEPVPDIAFSRPNTSTITSVGIQRHQLPLQSSIPESFNPQEPFSGPKVKSGDIFTNSTHRPKQVVQSINFDPAAFVAKQQALSKKQENKKHLSNNQDGHLSPILSQSQRQPSAKNMGRNFNECYILKDELGRGAFAKVLVGIEKATGREYAVKHIFDRSKMAWNGRDALLDEIANLKALRHSPFVVYLHESFLEGRECYMVMELLPGNDLFGCMIQKKTFTEKEARDACRCVLSGLAYMHERRMTHRDLKPENLLLADEFDPGRVKLADFGFSKTLESRNSCRTLCGTPGYLAPEILEQWPAYDVKCDAWSFGVVLFLLLGGYSPFDPYGSNDINQVFERTRNGEYHFFPQRWTGISQEAKDLIAKCLTVHPSQRISTTEALSHDWMAEGLALPQTMISAASLDTFVNQAKKHRQRRHKQRDVDRLKELNDDFTVFLEGHGGGASIVSAMTGTVKTVATFGGNTTSQNQCEEYSLTGKPFSHFYTKLSQIGKGGFGTVFRCMNKITGETFAVKQVNTAKWSKAEIATLSDEITALKYLRGAPYILRLYDVFQEGLVTHMVMEEMRGGDLLHRVVEKEVYTEREAQALCRTLFSAVNYCHRKRVAHRDIKLENLLLQEVGNDASIKLADFGFSKKVRRPNCLTTLLGTPGYMAPEILDQRSQGYDERCDIWSVGVVVYCLLGGYLPFQGNAAEQAKSALRGEYYFHDEYWRNTSPSARDLISGLLQVDPPRRLSMQQALGSQWITMEDSKLTVMDLSTTRSRLQNMITNKLKNAVRGIMVANRLQANANLKASIGDSNFGFAGKTVLGLDDYIEAASKSDAELSIEVTFQDVYEIGQPLGDGFLAKMYTATNLLTKKVYSVKKVVRKTLHPSDFAALSDELAALDEVSEGGKTHTVCLYEVYEDLDVTYMVMERIKGTILLDRLLQKHKYTEYDAKEIVRNLLHGVNHCHQKRIAIRNLTLDNLLLTNGSQSDILITDFEIAKKVLYKNALRTKCGTQEYVAPEVLEHRPAYDVACDMWAVGVISFLLLGGYYPFRGKTEAEQMKNARYGIYEFRQKFWKGVSQDAIGFLKKLIIVDPDERLTSEVGLRHRWINMEDSSLSKDLMSNVAEMKKEVASKFRRAVNTIVATQRLKQQI